MLTVRIEQASRERLEDQEAVLPGPVAVAKGEAPTNVKAGSIIGTGILLCGPMVACGFADSPPQAGRGEVQESGVKDWLKDVTFFNDRVGWAVGEAILRTHDLATC
jgi:hypothetical protein